MGGGGALLFNFLTLITELIVYNFDMTYPRHIKIETEIKMKIIFPVTSC